MNTPILTELEEKNAPWNESYKIVNATICMSISKDVLLKIQGNIDEPSPYELEKAASEQVNYPDLEGWIIDEYRIV